MVQAGAEDDHRFAVRDLGVAGELARGRDYLVARDPGDLLLPGGRIGFVVVIIPGNVVAAEAIVHPIVCHHQIKNRCHIFDAVFGLDLAHRNLVVKHAIINLPVSISREISKSIARYWSAVP